MYMETDDCNCGVDRLDIMQSLAWVCVHYIVFSHFYLFTYVQLQHDHVARNPKKESHMAYALYAKLAAGKFRHFSVASYSLDKCDCSNMGRAMTGENNFWAWRKHALFGCDSGGRCLLDIKVVGTKSQFNLLLTNWRTRGGVWDKIRSSGFERLDRSSNLLFLSSASIKSFNQPRTIPSASMWCLVHYGLPYFLLILLRKMSTTAFQLYLGCHPGVFTVGLGWCPVASMPCPCVVCWVLEPWISSACLFIVTI